MKLDINYDLIEKIKEANTGISLVNSNKRVLKRTASCMPICALFNIADGNLGLIMIDMFMLSGMFLSNETLKIMLLRNIRQKIAEQDLNELLGKLQTIDVRTNYENLTGANLYKTEYSFNSDKNRLEQRKYINIPVSDKWGVKNISICQEHMIGSKEWSLSIGSPKEQESKVYSLGRRRATSGA